MAYAEKNFKTKKALKEAVQKWKSGEGEPVGAYSPGPWPLTPGRTTIEGPHYPEPHKWGASCKIEEDGYGIMIITEVK